MIKCSTQRVTCKFKAIAELPCTSASKQVFVQSLSWQNEFDLPEYEPVCSRKFSKFGRLLSLIDGSVFSFPLRGIYQCLRYLYQQVGVWYSALGDFHNRCVHHFHS